MAHVGFVFNLHSHDRNCSCVCPWVLSRVKKEKLMRKAECDFRAPAYFTGDNNRAALGLHYFLADG